MLDGIKYILSYKSEYLMAVFMSAASEIAISPQILERKQASKVGKRSSSN